MKTTFSLFTIVLILTSCDFKSNPADQIRNIREDFGREAEIQNANLLKWDSLIGSLYKMSDTNQSATLDTINNLLNESNSFDRHQISELHFMKGDLYYRIDSLNSAVREFSIAGDSPKYLAARAGTFVKLKKYPDALSDLNRASEINYDYLWNVGNYYELTGSRDSAISCYNRLYLHDTTTYRFCKKRMEALMNPKTKLFKELVYNDRRRMTIRMDAIK